MPSLLALALTLLSGGGAQDAEPGTAPAALEDGGELAALRARDARVSFGPRSAERARARLVAGLQDPSARMAALMALGCAGAATDVPLLESNAQEGGATERRAATLALGEIGERGFPALERLAQRAPEGVEEELCLALVRTKSPAARELCVALAERDDGALATAAAAEIGRLEGEGSAGPHAALVQLFELRWSAAREYGFVDGRRWRELFVDELVKSREFLDRVIYGAALELTGAAVQDHLLEVVLDGTGPGRLRVAAQAIPEELGRLLQAGVWEPANLLEWTAILETLADERLERRGRVLVERAMEIPELVPLAGLLQFRSGEELAKRWFVQELREGSARRQAELFEAAGDRGDPARIDDLLVYLRDDQELPVRIACLVALERLGYERTNVGYEDLLYSGPSAARYELYLALARVTHDRKMANDARIALARDDLDPEVRFRLELALGLSGRAHARTFLREGVEDPERPLRTDVVRALGLRAAEEDLALFDELFPSEDDMDLNVELAKILIRYRQESGLWIVRRALWRGDWNQSVLAGGLLIRAFGVYGLVDELGAPPSDVRPGDLRRVGFALGEFGGLEAVEYLGRRASEKDPALQGALLGALSARTR